MRIRFTAETVSERILKIGRVDALRIKIDVFFFVGTRRIEHAINITSEFVRSCSF